MDAGFEGLGARDAHEAIRILEARINIGLVFTDVKIPGFMDGIKLAHYIRGALASSAFDRCVWQNICEGK